MLVHLYFLEQEPILHTREVQMQVYLKAKICSNQCNEILLKKIKYLSQSVLHNICEKVRDSIM